MRYVYTADDINEAHLNSYGNPTDECYGPAIAALCGDYRARDLMADHLSEYGEVDLELFKEGSTVLIETVTLYYVGRVVRRDGPFVVLEEASWVHWTGRKSTMARLKAFRGFQSSENQPRTEYVGDVAVSVHSMVAVLPGEWKLPTESIAS